MKERLRIKRAWEDLSLLTLCLVVGHADFHTYEAELGHFVRRWQRRGIPVKEWRRMRRLALQHVLSQAMFAGRSDGVVERLWRAYLHQRPRLLDRVSRIREWVARPPRSRAARQLLRRRVRALARAVAVSTLGRDSRRVLARLFEEDLALVE